MFTPQEMRRRTFGRKARIAPRQNIERVTKSTWRRITEENIGKGKETNTKEQKQTKNVHGFGHQKETIAWTLNVKMESSKREWNKGRRTDEGSIILGTKGMQGNPWWRQGRQRNKRGKYNKGGKQNIRQRNDSKAIQFACTPRCCQIRASGNVVDLPFSSILHNAIYIGRVTLLVDEDLTLALSWQKYSTTSALCPNFSTPTWLRKSHAALCNVLQTIVEEFSIVNNSWCTWSLVCFQYLTRSLHCLTLAILKLLRQPKLDPVLGGGWFLVVQRVRDPRRRWQNLRSTLQHCTYECFVWSHIAPTPTTH